MNALIDVERFFAWLLQTTWQAAVIVGIILLAQFLLRSRLSPAWRHGLWLLLVARLLMPIAPSSALSIFNLAKWLRPTFLPSRPSAVVSDAAAPASVLPATAVPAERSRVADRSPASISTALPDESPEPALTLPPLNVSPPAMAPPVIPPAAEQVSYVSIAAAVWLAGALMLLTRFLWLNLRFHRRLVGDLVVSTPETIALLRECAALVGIRNSPLLIETEQVETPAVYGLWRKRLLLPLDLRQQLSPDELRHVLLHELAHVKRRDPELNWLTAVLQILHWFNPVLWLGFARMRADRELATDDLALTRLRQPERRSYGETILKVLEQLAQRRVLPGLVGIGESKAQIKERIRAIARGTVSPRWRWAAGTVAVVIAGIAFTNARDESAANGINLLARYPTTLTAGDNDPANARDWRFTQDDLFVVSRFALEVGNMLRVDTGTADLGIGHGADGAVWAILIPRGDGKLSSSATNTTEAVAHVWLRFHPTQINRLFPPATVSADGTADVEERMRSIAQAKMRASWQSGGKALVPDPKDLTVDVDTQAGVRRCFVVDREARTAEYTDAFAGQVVDRAQMPYEPEVDPDHASVVSVSPANGATDIEPNQELRIRFDRPMNPQRLKLDWLAGGFQLNGSMQVAADKKEFMIPVRMTPGQEQKLAVNRDMEREIWFSTGQRPEFRPRFQQQREAFMDAQGAAANEFRWSFWTKSIAAKPDASKPRVVSVSPAAGESAPVLSFVELTFDRPMLPPDHLFPYLQKRNLGMGPTLIPSFDYDATAHRFTFPVLLPADDDARLTLRGFYSANGIAAAPVVLHCQTGTEALDPRYVSRSKAAANDPQLQKLLAAMKQARDRLTSGSATVQTINLRATKGAFTALAAQTASFKWQGMDRAYADISGVMSVNRFVLGCDGQTCWLYSVDERSGTRLERTPAAQTTKELILLDPFNLTKLPVQRALAEQRLVYASNTKLDGRSCYRVERWDVTTDMHVFATKTQWWIDEENFLLRQIVQYFPDTCQVVRFDYTDLNQPIPDAAFQPPVAPEDSTQATLFGKELAPGERHFFKISDGSNGRMSGRIGYEGPKGRTSSGLN